MAEFRHSWSARGDQFRFFADANCDKTLSALVALMQEVSVLRERLDTHERLAHAGRVATSESVQAFEADATTEAARAEQRLAYVRRIMRPFMDDAAQPNVAASPDAQPAKAYQKEDFRIEPDGTD